MLKKKWMWILSFIVVGVVIFLVSWEYLFQSTSKPPKHVHVRTEKNGYHAAYYFNDESNTIWLDTSGYVPKSVCSKEAQFFLLYSGLNGIHSCSRHPITLSNGEKGFLVDISYGGGMDCPSGCIYSNAYALVYRYQIHPIEGINYSLYSDSEIYYDLKLNHLTITNKR